KNLWLEECRNTRRRLSRLEQYNEPGAYDPVDRLLDGDEVLLAVKRLSDKMRAPILLKYAHGYSYEEISRILRIPLGTVKSRISNGMQNLKKELENDGKR
ncbi:MAG: sigma factor-like helix-turn-helix DNA-binding protein, partial [Clostridia bacterium]|nr:sigma factor-like helix-turn-helix DNA-binding protein [Clostridia bacterium]